jgi:hypothetical protein
MHGTAPKHAFCRSFASVSGITEASRHSAPLSTGVARYNTRMDTCFLSRKPLAVSPVMDRAFDDKAP